MKIAGLSPGLPRFLRRSPTYNITARACEHRLESMGVNNDQVSGEGLDSEAN